MEKKYTKLKRDLYAHECIMLHSINFTHCRAISKRKKHLPKQVPFPGTTD